jgi:flagellar basal body-associated protein FliL
MRAGLVISLLVIFLVSSGLAAVMMSQQKEKEMVGPSVVEAEVEPEMEPEMEPEVEPEAETTSPTTENYTYIKM